MCCGGACCFFAVLKVVFGNLFLVGLFPVSWLMLFCELGFYFFGVIVQLLRCVVKCDWMLQFWFVDLFFSSFRFCVGFGGLVWVVGIVCVHVGF